MPPSTYILVAGLLSLTLASCSGVKTPDIDVNTARNGTQWAQILGQALFTTASKRPSALLGTYVATYLSKSSTYRSALAGIETQMQLLFSEQTQEDEAYAVLEELGIILQVDIPDMLNRSVDRPHAFDVYIESLTTTATAAQNQLDRLNQELKEIQAERREKRKSQSTIM